MKRSFTAIVMLIVSLTAALAASGLQPAPPGTFNGAPPQYTRFSSAELTRGFLALAFGSDMRTGLEPRGIRRFDRPIRVAVIARGSLDRTAAMRRVLEDYAAKVANLHLSIVPGAGDADIEVRLIDDKDFAAALTAEFGAKIAGTFVKRTNPQCMTNVKSKAGDGIVRAISFVIVDKGDKVFLDCAYHELLHAFGLSNHDQSNAWTTLRHGRMVGYLTVYDRALLTLLYDPRIKPDMTAAEARRVLPGIIRDLGLAAPQKRK